MPANAQDASRQLDIQYRNALLTISAKNVDIGEFFSELARKADIYIEYPGTMNKKVSVNRKGISLDDFLSSFLRNMNYVLVFSGSDGASAAISEVYVYPDSKKSTLSDSARKRIAARIASYQKSIERIKNRLSQIDENSSRGKAYLRQISRYEKKIEDLQGQQ